MAVSDCHYLKFSKYDTSYSLSLLAENQSNWSNKAKTNCGAKKVNEIMFEVLGLRIILHFDLGVKKGVAIGPPKLFFSILQKMKSVDVLWMEKPL